MEIGKLSFLDRFRMVRERVKDTTVPSKDEVLSAISRSAGKIPFADDVVAMWYCAMDASTPSKVKASIIGALVYLVVPADTIPDIFAGLGFTDDITVLTAVIAMVATHIKPEHRDRARATLSINCADSDDDMPIKAED